MAYSNSNVNLEKMHCNSCQKRTQCSQMLKWLREQLMDAEVTSKVNATKSERNPDRSGYLSIPIFV